MKRILTGTVLMVLALPCYATGDNVATSAGYVDAALELKQATIPAAGASGVGAGSTVMTYTATSGTIGERALYTDASSYDASTDADKMITASALNGAITSMPTTTTTKLTCQNSPACTLWTISDQTAYAGAASGGGSTTAGLPEYFECDAMDVGINETAIYVCNVPEEPEMIGTVPNIYGKVLYELDGVYNGGCSAAHPTGITKGDVVATSVLGSTPGTNCYCPKFDGTGFVYLGQSNDYFTDNPDPMYIDSCQCPSACVNEMNSNTAFAAKIFGL